MVDERTDSVFRHRIRRHGMEMEVIARIIEAGIDQVLIKSDKEYP